MKLCLKKTLSDGLKRRGRPSKAPIRKMKATRNKKGKKRAGAALYLYTTPTCMYVCVLHIYMCVLHVAAAGMDGWIDGWMDGIG